MMNQDPIALAQLDWLAERAKTSPNQIALIFENQEWTYVELDQWVNQLCHVLIGISGKPALTYATLMSNQPIAIATIHTLARLGSIALPLNTRLSTEELGWQYQNNQPACQLLYSTEFENQANTIESDTAINLDQLDWQSTPITAPSKYEKNSIQGRFYTSGTTGQPKAAMLSFSNYVHSAGASAERLGNKPDDRWLLTMPLYHIGGQSIVFRACLAGIPIVLQNGFDPQKVYESIMRSKVSIISLVPTMLHRMLPLFQQHGLPENLRVVLLGGSEASTELLDKTLALNIPIALTYGLTEATSQVATATPAQVRAKPGSVGKALNGTTVKIIDEARMPVPANTVGEITVSGPTLMAGYYNNPTATAKALQADQLFTGDLGYLDDEGDLWVLARRSDLIISGGENIYPAEVERVLQSHPAIEETAVFGLPDLEWGQQVAAAIVTDAPIDEKVIIDYCRQQLGGYKIPRKIFFLSALPKTASGKIKRHAIADQFTNEMSEK